MNQSLISLVETMKTIVVLFSLAAVVLAEKEAPYPPSGWKPDGPQLTYPPPTPSNEYGPAPTPSNEYGPAPTPSNEYGPSPTPSNEYGPAPTPSNEYGPAPTAPPTEMPTEAPQEPASTYIPSEESTEEPQPGGGYSRYQSQRFSSRPSAQFNQAAGQFFIITPQGQLQHIPIVIPQGRTRDVENVEPDNDKRELTSRIVQQPARNENRHKGKMTLAENREAESGKRFSTSSNSHFERAQQKEGRQQKKETPMAPAQGPAQFVAFVPAVPLSQIQSAPMNQQLGQRNGQYHVIYPNGKLQRVRYMNMFDMNNRLTANVQYQDVDPIRGPLYTFGSPLVRVL